MRLRLTLINAGDTAVALVVLSATWARFDFVVSQRDGGVVWRRVSAPTVPLAGDDITLAPGDSLVLEDDWDQRDRRGRPVGPGT